MAKQPPKQEDASAIKADHKDERATEESPKCKSGATARFEDGRFKPGQSGNPKGRPRKERSLLKHIEEELDVEMQITENGKATRLTKRQALAKLIVNKALQEDDKKLNHLLRILPPAKDDGSDEHASVPLDTVLHFMMRKGAVDNSDGPSEEADND